ncbi:MAG: RDD family protein [Smithella sp.]
MATYKFAGFWRRLVAYTIDNIIINIIFFILAIVMATAFVFGSISGNSRTWMTDLTDPAYIASMTLSIGAIYIILSTAYFTFFHGINGRTPGKMLLGLQVLSTEGAPINFGIAFLRAVSYLVSNLLFIFPLGFIWAAFDKRKQAWHDKIAGTVVIIRSDESDTTSCLTIPEAHPDRQNEEKHKDDVTEENRTSVTRSMIDEQKTP